MREDSVGDMKGRGRVNHRRQISGAGKRAIADANPSAYLSPKDLADRWRCSRPTVSRIAERAGLSRFFLGEGRNGVVRYLRKEVEAYEESRRIQG